MPLCCKLSWCFNAMKQCQVIPMNDLQSGQLVQATLGQCSDRIWMESLIVSSRRIIPAINNFTDPY